MPTRPCKLTQRSVSKRRAGGPEVLRLLGELLPSEDGRHVVLTHFHASDLNVGVVLQGLCQDIHHSRCDVLSFALVVVELQKHIRGAAINPYLGALRSSLSDFIRMQLRDPRAKNWVAKLRS